MAQTILVTGATGTVGSEVVKQLSRDAPSYNIKAGFHSIENAKHFRQAVSSSEIQSSIIGLPPNTVMSSHLFRKVAVPGICVD